MNLKHMVNIVFIKMNAPTLRDKFPIKTRARTTWTFNMTHPVDAHFEANPLVDSIEGLKSRAEFFHRHCSDHVIVGKPEVSDVLAFDIDT